MNMGGLTPCFFCERDGGRTMFGKRWPKASAVAPFLTEQRWPTNPACATHGTQLSAYSQLVKEPLAVIAHRLEAVENSDVAWNEMPRAPTPSFVTAAVNAPPPASVARTATLDPVVAPEPTQPETSLSVASLRSDVPPPMTPDEEAAFDAGIQF